MYNVLYNYLLPVYSKFVTAMKRLKELLATAYHTKTLIAQQEVYSRKNLLSECFQKFIFFRRAEKEMPITHLPSIKRQAGIDTYKVTYRTWTHI